MFGSRPGDIQTTIRPPQPLERNREKRKYPKKDGRKTGLDRSARLPERFPDLYRLIFILSKLFHSVLWVGFSIKVVSSGFFDFRILGTRFFRWI
jgi:hypothetical protein